MPRYDKQQLGGSPRIESSKPQVGLGVAARPVDLTVQDRAGEEAAAIAESLAGLVPTLGVYAKQRQKEQDDADRLAGAKARDEQAGVDLSPNLREQSKAWQEGYLRQHGVRMSILDGEETERQYALRKDEPDFNIDQFFAERRQAGLKGMSDPDAYEGYAKQLLNVETRLRSEATKEQVLKARTEEYASRQTIIAETQRQIKDRSIAAAGTSLDVFQEAQYARGVPKDQSRNEWLTAAVNDPEAKPQDFEYLYLPDASGIPPVDRMGPGGKPWRVQVDAAKAHAQKREDDRWTHQMQDNAREESIKLDGILRENPLSITDPVEYVRQRSNVWNTGPEAVATIDRILKAQDEQREEQLFRSYISNGTILPRGLADNPRMKKAVNAEYMRGWANVNAADPDSLAGGIEASTKMFAQTGIPDPFIKSLSERVTTMQLVSTDKGGKTPSPEFQTALGIYKALRDSGNQNLGLFNDESRVFLEVFDTAFGTAEERFAAAKVAVDPQAKGAIKRMWNSGERDAAVKSVASDLKPWFQSPGNLDETAEYVVRQAELLRARGGNLDMKTALKIAKEQARAAYAYDGVGSMVRIPQDVPRERAQEYAKQYITDARAALPKGAADNYVIVPSTVNGRPGFRLTSPLGIDLFPPRTYEELDYAVRKAQGKTPEQIAAKQNARPTMSGAERDQRWAIDALRNGAINMQEFDTVMQDVNRRNEEARKATSQGSQEGAASIPVLPKVNTSDATVRVPVPQPLGPEMSPKAIALDRAKSDPFVALTAYGEGFKNKLFSDPNQRDTLIGFGYNTSVRSPEKVRADLVKAGVTDPERLARVLAGKDAITPDEAGRLANLVKDKSAGVAIEVLGQKTWDALPDNKRAALIDLAYQAGDNSSAFRSALSNLQKGNEQGVMAALEVSYFKQKDQKRVKDHRRNALRLAMWESPERFQQLVSAGI